MNAHVPQERQLALAVLSYRASAPQIRSEPVHAATSGLPLGSLPALLKAKSTACGVSAEQYALRVLEQDLAPEWLRKSWASAAEAGLDRLSMDEIDAEIAAAGK